jgi:hypothetical protein
MLLSPTQNARQNYNVNITNMSFKNVAQVKYVGMTDQSLIQEEIKRRLDLHNACYHSVQNLLFSHLLPKIVKIIMYKTVIFPVVMYVCETWSLTLREERRLRVFKNRVLRIFRPKRDEVIGGWRKLYNEELRKCTLHQV